MIRNNIVQAAQAARRVAYSARKLSRFLETTEAAIVEHGLTADQRTAAINKLAQFESDLANAVSLYTTISQATTVQPYRDGEPNQ